MLEKDFLNGSEITINKIGKGINKIGYICECLYDIISTDRRSFGIYVDDVLIRFEIILKSERMLTIHYCPICGTKLS